MSGARERETGDGPLFVLQRRTRDGIASALDDLLESDPRLPHDVRDSPDRAEGVLGLIHVLGKANTTLKQNMGLKSAFRWRDVVSAGAEDAGQYFEGYLFINMQLQLGWRGGGGGE